MNSKEAKKILNSFINSAFESCSKMDSEESYLSALDSLRFKSRVLEGLVIERSRADVTFFLGALACRKAVHYFEIAELRAIDQFLVRCAI